MKFRKALKLMQNDPKLMMGSVDASSQRQTYETILFWLFDSEHSKKERIRNFETYMKATDWEVNNV